MISVIVCSINNTLFKNFEASVAKTIGTKYEIIQINNSKNLYNISEAYNKGALKAIFPYLCFVHEDVLFKTNDWGNTLITLFKNDPTVGAVGVAGSKYKSLSPSGWPNSRADLDCYNYVQYYKTENEKILQTNNPEINELVSEVKTLDGVLIFTKKDIWETNEFDSNTFKGFHCYDLDFCLQVGRKHKILVTYQCLIEHFSEGMARSEWAKSAILLSKKWKKELPVGNLDHIEKVKIEWY